MIQSITELIAEIRKDLDTWEPGSKPWFLGESGDNPNLCPKIASFEHYKENYLLHVNTDVILYQFHRYNSIPFPPVM